jgi:hypothetical protein
MTRKETLISRLTVKPIGRGHYVWSLQYRGRIKKYTSSEAPFYDAFKHDEMTLNELQHLIRLIHYYGN